MHTRFRLNAMVCACMLGISVGAARATNQFTETFTTTAYKDVANTTADWNVAAGQLTLFPLPALVASVAMPGNALGVTVVGHLVFVGARSAGLKIIDITNPASPTTVGTFDTPGLAEGVAVSGNLALVADNATGLMIIDISNPASPGFVGLYNTPGVARGVAVAGNFAFVADGPSGLQIIDFTNPVSPTLVGSHDTPGNAIGVTVVGDLAYVADDTALQIIGITSPASPTFVGSYDTPANARAVAVAGQLALVADNTSGLQIIDVTSPASPTFVGSYDTPGNASGVTASGGVAFVADNSAGLQIIDISNPASPTLTGSYDTTGIARSVAVTGDLACVADDSGGLRILTVREIATPTLVGSHDTPGFARDITVDGDLAFVADQASGLQIIDVSNPVTPTLVGTYDTPGFAAGVTVAGQLAFVADDIGGVQVIDVVDPASPTLVGSYDTPNIARDVAVAGNLAFVADQASGLHIIDVSDAASPTLAGSYNTPGLALGVAVVGDLAFVADLSALLILDVSNPQSPTLVGSYNTPGDAWGLVVAGDLAFVADQAAGLHIVDVGNPASPSAVGSYNTPGNALGVAVAGEHALVADDAAGLQVISITNAASPTLTSTYNTAGNAWSVVGGDLAFVADNATGLQVIRVFQDDVDTSRNIGRSLAVDGSPDTIRWLRLTTTETAGVTWEVSANAGTNWQAITPDNSWRSVVPGSAVVWRSTLAWTAPELNPAVSDLHLEWLYDYPLIDAITDVADDQGRWVWLDFTRSARDFAAEASLPIAQYGIWRRVDNAAALAALAAAARTAAGPDGAAVKVFGGLPVVTSGDRVFVQSGGRGSVIAGFPPGTWGLVQNVPAVQEDSYLAEVHTEADSTVNGTAYTVLVVTAHTTTPAIWYASAPDSGYSIDNLAPGVPENFVVTYNTGSGNALAWNVSPDADFQYFRVYRSTDPAFTPSLATWVHSTATNHWVDPDHDSPAVTYKVTATDFSGNQSGPASFDAPTSVGGSAVPKAFALYPNVPNPFNPMTLIRYDVPESGGNVTLRIYDVGGRLVRTLVAGHLSPGGKSVTWDGRDDAGGLAASGVYFYRLTAPGYTMTHKLVLTE